VWWAFLATGGGDLAAQEAWAGFVSRHALGVQPVLVRRDAHRQLQRDLPYLMAALGVRTVTVLSGSPPPGWPPC